MAWEDQDPDEVLGRLQRKIERLEQQWSRPLHALCLPPNSHAGRARTTAVGSGVSEGKRFAAGSRTPWTWLAGQSARKRCTAAASGTRCALCNGRRMWTSHHP
jgi:hypothetical protein